MRAMARLPECSWAFLTGSARTGGSRRRSFHGTLPLLYKLRSVQGREAEGHPGARVHPLRAQEPSGFEDVRVVRRVAGAPARRHQHGEHGRLQHAVAPAPRRSLCDEPVFPGGIDRGKRGPASRAEALLENIECAARRKKREAAPFSMQPPSFLPFTGGVCVRAARAGRGDCRPPVRAWKAEGSVEPSRRGGLQYLSRYDRGVRHGAAWRRVHSTRSPVGQKRPRIPVRARLP